jgi:hypothetical protein
METNEKIGPGTALANTIPDWAVQFKKGCGCKDMQKKMDRWGVEGCQKNFDFIVTHLMSQSDKLIPGFRLVPAPARKVVATHLLKHAIRVASR